MSIFNLKLRHTWFWKIYFTARRILISRYYQASDFEWEFLQWFRNWRKLFWKHSLNQLSIAFIPNIRQIQKISSYFVLLRKNYSFFSFVYFEKPDFEFHYFLVSVNYLKFYHVQDIDWKKIPRVSFWSL